ncbi:hypothetical protein BgiMline_000685 [Biomphalaria glabrata]
MPGLSEGKRYASWMCHWECPVWRFPVDECFWQVQRRRSHQQANSRGVLSSMIHSFLLSLNLQITHHGICRKRLKRNGARVLRGASRVEPARKQDQKPNVESVISSTSDAGDDSGEAKKNLARNRTKK